LPCFFLVSGNLIGYRELKKLNSREGLNRPMFFLLYRTFLKFPTFRGKPYIQNWMKRKLAPHHCKVARGIIMELDPQEWTQIELLKSGTLEPKTVNYFSHFLSQGGTYIDVGAHVGFHALVARSLVGTSGRVIAVDPQPYNCEKILTNCRLNAFNNVTVYVAAAGDRSGTVTLNAQPLKDKARLTLSGNNSHDTGEAFIVPLMRLDDLIAESKLERIDLLKIDVEGYELAVLRGLGNTISIVRAIILEVLPDTPLNIASEIASHLAGAGFSLHTLDGHDWKSGQPCTENNVIASRHAT
jgi:FkbM family methyltransferase